MQETCIGIKPDGAQCVAEPLPGSSYCWNHAPEYAEIRRANALKGNRTAGRGRPAMGHSELDRLYQKLETLASNVEDGSISEGKAFALTNVYRAMIAIIKEKRENWKDDVLYVRLEELAQQINGSSAGGQEWEAG